MAIYDSLIAASSAAWQAATAAGAAIPADASDPAKFSEALTRFQLATNFAATTEQNVSKVIDKAFSAHSAVANNR